MKLIFYHFLNLFFAYLAAYLPRRFYKYAYKCSKLSFLYGYRVHRLKYNPDGSLRKGPTQ